MEMKGPAAILPDIDHATGDQFFAERADASIVERQPAPDRVSLLEDGQLLVESDVTIRSASHSIDD